jgi:Rrf2 family protein
LKLSVKSDYAVRAVLSLARRFGGDEVTRIETLATENNIPPNYLVQILIELKSTGIVRSIRGKEGGYQLDRPPAKITFGEVLRTIHGPLFDSPAIGDEKCPTELREAWKRLSETVEREADAVTFQQLLDAGADRTRMFYI